MKVRTKDIEVEVIEWKGNNVQEVKEFMRRAYIARTRDHTLGYLTTTAVFVQRRSKDMNETLWKNIADDNWSSDITAAVYDVLHETYVGVKNGQFIICGLAGEFYQCDPDTLWAKYEEVREVTEDDIEGNTCDIGQRLRCGKPAVGVFSTAAIQDNVWAVRRFHDRGVVFVCEGHFNKPICDW
jgi:hypothetical protein